MSTILSQWQLPPNTGNQRPIEHVRIDIRVDPSLPWKVQDIVLAGAMQEMRFFDVADGTYFYRGTIVDDQQTPGPVPAEIEITLKDGVIVEAPVFDPPGTILNFTATVE